MSFAWSGPACSAGNSTRSAAALALPQAAATLAVAVTRLQAGVLDQEIVDAIYIVIFLTCLIGPLLTRAAGARLAASVQQL
jgi:hypothetical protein